MEARRNLDQHTAHFVSRIFDYILAIRIEATYEKFDRSWYSEGFGRRRECVQVEKLFRCWCKIDYLPKMWIVLKVISISICSIIWSLYLLLCYRGYPYVSRLEMWDPKQQRFRWKWNQWRHFSWAVQQYNTECLEFFNSEYCTECVLDSYNILLEGCKISIGLWKSLNGCVKQLFGKLMPQH